MDKNWQMTRRRLLQTTTLAGGGLALGGVLPALAGAADTALITRRVPGSGEVLPVIGVGTNNYGVSAAEDIAARREVLEALSQLANSVVDTANVYGESEAVIGNILRDTGIRKRLFIATKTPMRGDFSQAEAMVQWSFERLQVETIDLMMVHNLAGLEELMPAILRAKEAGRVRYVGMSTSTDEQYPEIMAAMRRYPLDFLQVDYSIDNRSAEQEVLPLAQERDIAVMINTPFGGRRRAASLFARVAEQPLPDFAADIDVASWAQLFLKYVVSHPATTVTIPGMTRLRHLQDNLGAGRGRLPDAALRREIERYWDALD